MAIHPTAVVSPEAEVDVDAEVDAYAVIGAGVRLGAGSVVMHHASVQGPCRIGEHNVIHPFASIGGKSQDLKYDGEPTYLEIGNYNEIREFVTINRATSPGEKTMVGSHNLFQAYCHIAHNCHVGDHCVFSSHATLAGHVVVEDHVWFGGLAGAHQFCRMGTHSLVGGCTKIVQDVPPYLIADGNPAVIRSVNVVGMQRRGFSEDTIRDIKSAQRLLYREDLNTTQAVEKLEEEMGELPEVKRLIAFVRASERGIIR